MDKGDHSAGTAAASPAVDCFLGCSRIAMTPSIAAAAGLIAYEPVGVVAAIAPWNGPFGIMLNKVAYALAGGCTTASLR